MFIINIYNVISYVYLCQSLAENLIFDFTRRLLQINVFDKAVPKFTTRQSYYLNVITQHAYQRCIQVLFSISPSALTTFQQFYNSTC